MGLGAQGSPMTDIQRVAARSEKPEFLGCSKGASSGQEHPLSLRRGGVGVLGQGRGQGAENHPGAQASWTARLYVFQLYKYEMAFFLLLFSGPPTGV